MYNIPIVIEKTAQGERSYDIYSRLLKDRIIMLNGVIDNESANSIIAQLLFLANEDDKKDISIYINSPGGEISAGLAIYDTIQYIKPDVQTICVGLAASMAAFLLASGTKGKRYALKNSEVMIHQPLGGVSGQASDIKIAADHIIKIKEKMNKELSKLTGKSYEQICADTDRDNYMSAEEAKEYGIIDEVLLKK